MNRAITALLCAASLLAVPASARVVLIGVDGATWRLIDPLLAAGRLPSLAAIAGRGGTAEIETVEPVNSPTVWTSIATGRSPDAHGVTDFLKKSISVQVPTIFERLAAQGKRVGTYDYLVTWPPRRLPGGFVIPGWLRRDESVTPTDAFERAGLPGYRYSLKGLGGREDYVAASRRELAHKAAHWNALAEAFDLDVGAVTFYSFDGLSHRFWHECLGARGGATPRVPGRYPHPRGSGGIVPRALDPAGVPGGAPSTPHPRGGSSASSGAGPLRSFRR